MKAPRRTERGDGSVTGPGALRPHVGLRRRVGSLRL